ncbi:capsid assembly protein [Anaeroselena agilis]|uniref:Capsid and scaffold protein n=1 Tax=Anaeroselena agilis TaxID=3063788 RepID=A0ABU3NV02_9FIRM|nr:hypothetical protein [Selenomonadales bacterium 4137-cl]
MVGEDIKATPEEIYGKNAVVGTVADSVQGQQVTIQTAGSQTVKVSAEDLVSKGADAPKADPAEEQAKEKAPEKPSGTEETAESETGEESGEDVLAADLKEQLEASAAAEKDLTEKGLDFKALEAEFMNTGTLSAASMEALAKVGYPEQVVKAYLSGLTATVERFTSKVYEMAGGKETYKQITGFIKAQGKGHVDAFNAAIDRGDMKNLEIILRDAKAQITAARGTANPTITGGTKPSAPGGFSSEAELIAAMSDPRYGRDSAYRASVEKKVAKSTIFS